MPALWSPDRYRAAYRFAAEAHHGQLVPATNLPYLLHIGMVAMEVMTALTHEAGHDADLAIACALLHDVLEDTRVPAAQLLAVFGVPVHDGVQALTKNAALPKADQMPDSLARIRQQPAVIGMVKLADRITNLQPPPYTWSNVKRSQYRDEAWTIYTALSHTSPYLAHRLRQHIEQYTSYLE